MASVIDEHVEDPKGSAVFDPVKPLLHATMGCPADKAVVFKRIFLIRIVPALFNHGFEDARKLDISATSAFPFLEKAISTLQSFIRTDSDDATVAAYK